MRPLASRFAFVNAQSPSKVVWSFMYTAASMP